jgi:hypothetical protein
MKTVIDWLYTWLGLSNPSGPQYLAWSGFIPALTGLTFIGGILTHFRHKNCYAKGCWRLGHPDPSLGGLPACRRHHSVLQ